MIHARLVTAAAFSILSVITFLITPPVLSSLNETKSVGQHIVELSDEINQSRNGGNLNFDGLSLDYHSQKYKRLSLTLDVIAYGSLAFAFILSFISMLKNDHKYAHYIIWVICAIAIGIKLTMLFAGAVIFVVIIIAALALSGS